MFMYITISVLSEDIETAGVGLQFCSNTHNALVIVIDNNMI